MRLNYFFPKGFLRSNYLHLPPTYTVQEIVPETLKIICILFLSLLTYFCFVFLDRVSWNCLCWPWTYNPPASASQVAMIIGVHHCAWSSIILKCHSLTGHSSLSWMWILFLFICFLHRRNTWSAVKDTFAVVVTSILLQATHAQGLVLLTTCLSGP